MLRQRRPLTMLVLACALFLRVWVPAGWMPSANGGAFAIEPCAAAAPMPMDHGSKHDPSHKAQHDGDCSFAPHHAGIAPITLPSALATPAEVAAAPIQRQRAPFFAIGPPAPPPPATGPPAIA